MDNSDKAFFELLRAGLWESEVQFMPFNEVNFSEVYRIAEDQCVLGLVAAGLEHVVDMKVPQKITLHFAVVAMQLEQRNKAMNQFIVAFLKKLIKSGVDSVPIKGQEVAQCYERPLWRASGDIDLLMNDENFERGKLLLDSLSETKTKEYDFNKEYIATIDGWCVELHGSLRSSLSAALNKVADAVQWDICDNHNIRYWDLNGIQIALPEANNDALLILHTLLNIFIKVVLVSDKFVTGAGYCGNTGIT